MEPLDASVFEHSGGADLEFVEGTEVSFAPVPDADMRAIEYNNPDGDRVTGIIAYPPDGPTEVGVIILPGLPESAAQNLEPLALLSCAGATALALDAPDDRTQRFGGTLLARRRAFRTVGSRARGTAGSLG